MEEMKKSHADEIAKLKAEVEEIKKRHADDLLILQKIWVLLELDEPNPFTNSEQAEEANKVQLKKVEVILQSAK